MARVGQEQQTNLQPGLSRKRFLELVTVMAGGLVIGDSLDKASKVATSTLALSRAVFNFWSRGSTDQQVSVADVSSDHFKINHGVDIVIENGWSPEEKTAIRQGVLQNQHALEEFFGPPADNFPKFQIKKKTPAESTKLAKDTGMAFDVFPGWTQCHDGICEVTLERAPMGNPEDITTLVHELANAWQGGQDGASSPFSPILNYDRGTEPPAVVYKLGSFFETDSLSFLADKFIDSKRSGVPFKSIDRLSQAVIDADPQFLAKLRIEMGKLHLDSQTKLTWQQATDLIEKASTPVGKIFKSLKTTSNK